MSKNKRKLVLLIVVLGLFTMACSMTTLSVANQSDYKVLVSVTLPGASGADSHVYQPGEVYDYRPGSGGSFTISVIPQEDYVAEMDKLRAVIVRALFDYQQSIIPETLIDLTEQLADIDRNLSSLTTHSCQGNIMEDSNVMATINISKDGQITLYCPSLSAGP
jgi:hypothetical protein